MTDDRAASCDTEDNRQPVCYNMLIHYYLCQVLATINSSP